MPYIYCIENLVNHKKYVGQTCATVSHRFTRHIIDSRKDYLKNRPLYSAIRKYGESNFSISLLEEVDSTNVATRESYWIQRLDTYKNGYNATLGGEGAPRHNYELIAKRYIELGNVTKVSEEFSCDKKTVRIACERYNVHINKQPNNHAKPVAMLDMDGTVLQTFKSATDAGKAIRPDNPRAGANIRQCIYGKISSAYGFQWSFV